MIKVGITGQPGFIGTHLYNYFGLQTEKFERIEFKDEFFEQPEQLREFVSKCDAIVHLAALNRHNDPDTIYKVNLELVNKLITATEETGNYPHIVFSSSTQEERDNIYGKSKREGRELLENGRTAIMLNLPAWLSLTYSDLSADLFIIPLSLLSPIKLLKAKHQKFRWTQSSILLMWVR